MTGRELRCLPVITQHGRTTLTSGSSTSPWIEQSSSVISTLLDERSIVFWRGDRRPLMFLNWWTGVGLLIRCRVWVCLLGDATPSFDIDQLCERPLGVSLGRPRIPNPVVTLRPVLGQDSFGVCLV